MDHDYEGAAEIERAWREGLMPDPLLTVSEWSDRHRMLSSKASAEPGRWRTSRTPYLKAIMDCLSPTSPVERVVFMKAAQLGAPLAIDTPIPTPTGWTTMGELAVGDYVFADDGLPTRVLGVSEVMSGRECYAVEFDDGEIVVTDAPHRWSVREASHTGAHLRIVTTADMSGHERWAAGKRWRYTIDTCQPVELPDRILPIHPYVLGLWLGDGSSWMNHLRMHEDDVDIVEHLQACDVEAVFRLPHWRKGKCANVVIDPTFKTRDEQGKPVATCGASRFSTRLRQLDLLDNKHIPPAYLRGSRAQRLELVRGLMDSDGSITPDGKRCEFGNTNERLIQGLTELLRSLGYKPSVYCVQASNGEIRGCEVVRQPAWRISWTAYREEAMFRLARKTARMRSVANGRPYKSRRRAVVSVRPVDSVPVRCIAVEAPSHLYLCGRGWIPTHNTEMGSNWIGYVIHHAPGPMMAVWPTVEMAKRNSKQRIDPLIEESAALVELIAPARSRDSGNTILAKEFRGGVLVMTGANSAVGLRSMPVRYLFLDEVDGYPLDVEGEGDAISLAEARTRTFARRKIFIVSTPTISGASAIEREYEASDQRRFFVPCPHCSHRQWLRFEQLRWDKGQPETAAYVCECCDTAIAEHHKTWMLEHGEWRAMVEDSNGKTAGFHLSSLYSPVGWRSWRDIAAAWEAAVSKESGSAAAIKTFKNTELGETWVEEGEAPDWQRLIERREDYPLGQVPEGGLLLVGGADVQKDRIEASIWAFGRGKASWLVEHRVLMGDTARDAVWKRLGELLAEHWTHASGVTMPLARFALDTGFATQEAYAFVRACRDSRVMAVKGVARGAALIGTPTAVDVSQAGKKLRRGIKVYSVAVGIAKLEFYNNLRKSADVMDDGVTVTYPMGFVHLPKIDAEFIQQLCAEQLITRRDRNGFPIREWQKMRERNEALDCYVYARAAASAAGLDRFEERHWRELERQLGMAPPPDAPPPLTDIELNKATLSGGLAVSGNRNTGRRVIKSRWLG